MTLEAILDAALTLSNEQRADLADRLLDSIPEGRTDTLHPAWREAIARRSAEMDAGLVTPIPWEEVRRTARDEILGTPPRG